MGIYDRDYYRQTPSRGGIGSFSIRAVTTWLILLNIAVFISDGVLRQYQIHQDFPDYERVPQWMLRALRYTGPIEAWGYFSSAKAFSQFQLWRLISFQFLHADLGHLLSNMLGLFFFGPMVEAYFGSRRYLGFYLLCGVSGAVAYLILLSAGMLRGGPNTPLIGASAGIFGVLMAAALVAPDIRVMFLFVPYPIKLKYMALIMMGLAAYTVYSSGHNAGGEAAHLGGGIVGFLFARYPWLLSPMSYLRRRRMRVRY